jgi:tRNA pseudouridine55 synthase
VDGILLIDKPSGPTSHDVVARIRRTIGQRDVGHTGTLDPRATGLLPLVVGRATKLASLLTGRDKTYDATIRLGFSTDTDDTEGAPLGVAVNALPTDEIITGALERFRGPIEQTPPRHSAKKVQGERAYDLARRSAAVELAPVPVTVHTLEWVGRTGDLVHLRVTASSGFYVRALARDLGTALGCGGHLAALRRTRSGGFDVKSAVPLDEAERLSAGLADRLILPADALPDLAAVRVTEAGLKRVTHGNAVGPDLLEAHWLPTGAAARHPVRVLAPDGHLVALAHARGGALHPVVVLG